jgi:hypothetical protein
VACLEGVAGFNKQECKFSQNTVALPWEIQNWERSVSHHCVACILVYNPKWFGEDM